MAANSPPSPSPSQLPPIPASPTYSYASTANPLSQYNLPPPPPPRPSHAVLTKADLANSQAAYSDLLASAKAYRLALASLSTAASSFGAALESCARLKEARAELTTPPPGAGSGSHNGGVGAPQSTCTADALLTTAGLHLLIANHQHILSETVYRAFEVPLLHDLDKWRAGVDDEEESYTRAVETQSREIRRLERDGVKMMNRQRRRDVGQLRSHLVELTGKLDGLTVLHGEHARTLLRESQEASGRIVDASCSLVRAEVDIFESLARKGWTGGGLEDVLERGVDLFAAEMEDPLTGGMGSDGKGGIGGDNNSGSGGFGVAGGDGTKLFSILPPKSILADTNSGSDTARGGGGVSTGKETRSDSLLVGDSDRYQSLASAVSRGRDRGDTDSVFPTTEFNRSRNVRPFSPQPQPLKLNPMDLLGGIQDEVAGASSSTSALRKDDGGCRGHEDIAEADEDCADEDEDEDEDDDDHPWRNEGLRRGSSDHGGQDKAGTSPGHTQPRKGTWSDTTDQRSINS
ncbi:uncharacterized protein C8A04DRAFT_10683 [Dichotomopilus funicola]|uniref:Phospholipid-binding protein n=1 Tax=Dichotomopilus funicola TaxID=1934379 RepID=A0AAN6V6J1_9PEZI|nr:hypothetical protein C8A04DRAFT_10683 [Dichotomopilus funicola]